MRETWLEGCERAVVVAAAIGLGLAGLLLLWAGAEEGPLWQQADAIFGVPTRALLRVGSIAHLLLAACMAFARNRVTQALLALWLALNYTVYRAGLVWMGEKGLPPVLQCTGEVAGIKPQTLNAAWTWFTVYLVVGGLMVLWAERRRRKRIEAEDFIERWRKLREQGRRA